MVKDYLTAPVCGTLLRSLLLFPTAQITETEELKDTLAVIEKLITLHSALDVLKSQDEDGIQYKRNKRNEIKKIKEI